MPQPPFSAEAFRFALLMVTICFKKTPHFICFAIIAHLYYNTVGFFFQGGKREILPASLWGNKACRIVEKVLFPRDSPPSPNPLPPMGEGGYCFIQQRGAARPSALPAQVAAPPAPQNLKLRLFLQTKIPTFPRGSDHRFINRRSCPKKKDRKCRTENCRPLREYHRPRVRPPPDLPPQGPRPPQP